MATLGQMKKQFETLRALKVELAKVREEELSTSDRARYEFLKTEEYPRLTNLVYDAARDFEETFLEVFGVYPSSLQEATCSHGYVISKRFPIRER